MKNEFTSQRLAEAFTEHRARLLSLVEKRLNPILLKRLSHEDVMQETYLAAAKRLEYFAQNADVPIYFKLRTILLQTLVDIERRNLQAVGRDAYREAEVVDGTTSECASGALNWGQFAADVTSPLSRVDRDERHALLRAAIGELPGKRPEQLKTASRKSCSTLSKVFPDSDFAASRQRAGSVLAFRRRCGERKCHH